MFGSFMPSFGGGNKSKNSYDSNNFSAGNAYKPSFGASFGANYQSPNGYSSSKPQVSQMSSMPGFFGNPSSNQQPKAMMNQQSRAMAPSMGFGGFNNIWNPQSFAGSTLRDLNTGQNVDLSQNPFPSGIGGGLFEKLRSRMQF